MTSPEDTEPDEGVPSPDVRQPEAEPTPDQAKPEEQPKEWWDDPKLPWRHKPTKTDLACWAWIAVVGVYGLVMLPLRPVLLGLSPPVSAAINGGRTSVVATGAWTAVNGGPILLYWLASTLSIVKFDWIYWWAGKLWGDGIIDVFAGRSKGARRRAERAVRLTHRYDILAVALTYVPIPFPTAVVYAAVGAAGMSLKKFLTVNIAIAGIFQAIYLAIGWKIGEPAVALVKIYADYMWYVSIALLVGMLVAAWWRSRRSVAG